MASFDHAASDYDFVFTRSCVGIAQRNQVWKYVDSYVTGRAESVLEINCGTGHDAHLWKTRGKDILATDISEEMVEKASSKYPEIAFETLDLRNIASIDKPVDTIFSNFGGLNCLAPEDLQDFFKNASGLLPDGGFLVVVIMGKKCLWDRLYLSVKGKFKHRNRRNTFEAIEVDVEGEAVPTWYYDPRQLSEYSESYFYRITCRPIGLFVPPSYLAPAFERRPFIFRIVKTLDAVFTHPGFSNYADHFVMILQKK